MKIVQYNEYIVGTVDTDGLVLWHQGVNNYSANGECAPMHFQLFMVNSWKCLNCDFFCWFL